MNSETKLVCFRKAISLDTVPTKCLVKVTADSRYKLYFNGNFVNEGPSKGDLETWYADTIDLAPYLAAGENVIAAEVLRIADNPDRANASLYRTSWPCFYIADAGIEGGPEGLTLNAKEDYKCKIAASTVFRAEKHSPAPIKMLEDVTGDVAFAGWKAAGYDDSAWAVAVSYTIMNINQATVFNLLYFLRWELSTYAGTFVCYVERMIFKIDFQDDFDIWNKKRHLCRRNWQFLST